MHDLAGFVPQIRSLRFFSGIRDEDILRVLEEGEFVSFPAGRVIFGEGDASDGNAYVILSGGVSVAIEDRAVATLGPGEVFGEYALISDEARTATVRADGETRCVTVSESALLRLVSEYPELNAVVTDRIKSNIRANIGAFRNA